jgi:hypothetical protein
VEYFQFSVYFTRPLYIDTGPFVLVHMLCRTVDS